MIVSRSKKRFRTARAAWADIHKKRNMSLKVYAARRMDTLKFYRWDVKRKV